MRLAIFTKKSERENKLEKKTIRNKVDFIFHNIY